jgi:lysophospholipase L1-like esterase
VITFVDDPVLLFENDPGTKSTLEYRERSGAPVRVVEAHVNADSFRGPVRAKEKPAGVTRIACIGDSHTFGYGVEDDRTWPAFLQQELGRGSSEGGVEVLNCGVNGYDTMQEVLWLEKRVLAFEPDLVLLQYYINDTAARGLPADESLPRDRIFELTHPRRRGWIGELRRLSRFADLVLDNVHRRRALAVYSSMRQARYGEEQPGWLRVQEGLLRARDLLAARGIRFAVVLYPFLVRQEGRLTSHEAFEIVKAFCRRENIACLDTERAFLPHELAPLRVHTQDYHANAAAHRIFAAAVAEWLRGSEVLTPVSMMR